MVFENRSEASQKCKLTHGENRYVCSEYEELGVYASIFDPKS